MSESGGPNPFQSPHFKLIPSHFNRCGCVSFSCTNCCVTNCFGGKCSGRSCFCIEGHGMFWKRVMHGINCCACISGDFQLTNPQSCCALYQQLFCLECFWTSSCAEAGFEDPPVALSILERKYVPESMGKSIVAVGGCCWLASIYYNFYSMLGNYNRQTFLCMETEFVATRYYESHDKQDKEVVCKLFQGHASVGSQCQWLKSVSQSFCFDIRVALPCDEEVPMACTCLPFCTLFAGGWFNILCMKSVNDLATLSYPDTTRYSHAHGDSVVGAGAGASGSGSNGGVSGAGDGSGGGAGVLPIGSHLVIPVHTTGTGNDTGIQYAEVVCSMDEARDGMDKSESSAPVQYAEAVSVDTRRHIL